MSLLSAVLQEADKVDSEDCKKYSENISPGIKELTEKVQMLSFDLQQNFIDSYANFTVTKSLEQLNYKSRKSCIYSDYEKLQADIKKLQEKFEYQDNDFQLSYNKLNLLFDKLKDLCIVVEGKRTLDHAEHEFGRYNYSEAILSVKSLQEQLKSLNFVGDSKKALDNLTAQAENQVSIYTAHCSVEWEEIFKWSEKKGLNYLTYSLSVQQSDPILIEKVLKNLYEINHLNAELSLFSHFFINKLVEDVIKHNCDIYNEEHIGAIVFNIKIDLNDDKMPNYNTIFTNLTAIFEFLQTTLGSHLEQFIAVFSKSIKQKFFDIIIDKCVRNNLPSCNSSYVNYEKLVAELDSFNKFLIELKFTNTDDSPLNKFIQDTENVLYNKKCDKLLFDVRKLLSDSLSFGTVKVGSPRDEENNSVFDLTGLDKWDINKPIFLPPCVISSNVKQIMELIVEHLNESTDLPDKYSKQLVTCIKNIALMYQAIVPKKFKVHLEGCPLDIALFFNNCYYLAHGLVGPPWKLVLPQSTAQLLVIELFEIIQDLRIEGLEKISLYLQQQKNVITKIIEPEELMLWSHDVFEQFDGALNFALSVMKDLKTNWYNILPTRMYELSLCTLIQAACQSTLNRILADSKPIREDIVYMIVVRIDDLIEELVSLFEKPIELERNVSIWGKFIKLPLLLKGQLLEIANLWSKEKDIPKYFSCEEVRQIIKIRFPDNKYRLKILKEIQ